MSQVSPIYDVKRTGNFRVITPEQDQPFELPEVEVTHQYHVGMMDHYDRVVLLDNEPFYLVQAQWYYDGDICATLLCKELYGIDYGGNVHRTRTAPQRRIGISAKIGALPIKLKHGPYVYALKPLTETQSPNKRA